MTIKENFDSLIAEVQRCRKCTRMDKSERVLGYGCGSLTPNVMFIGEAPGRLGADSSLMPFHGDKSGHNFEGLLEQVGLSRYDAFITNAVLCNPKDESGNNSPPTKTEIQNCAAFLQRQVEIIQPKVVATLGSVALKSCALASRHELRLADHVRTANKWNGRLLIPMYHPGQRAMLHRSFANQLADYQFLKETLARSTTKRVKKVSGKASEQVVEVVNYLIEREANLSYFALHKLLFLAEVRHLEEYGERMTASYVVRQKDGPYFVELHPNKLAAFGIGVVCKPRLSVIRQLELSSNTQFELPTSWARVLDEVLKKYAGLSEADLKRSVYLTKPMRELLRREKQSRVNMFNAPLLVN